DVLLLAARVVDLLEELAQLRRALVRAQHLLDAVSHALRGPPEVGLEDLAHVHARRHPERVQHDVDGRPVGHERHVLHRHDLRDDALVAVAAGHLVAGLQPPLHRDVDLTIFCTPGGSSSPCVSFFFFSSNARSNSFLVRSSDSRSCSSWAAASSSERRMSNQSWRSISCRYALVTLAPFASFLPPFAVLLVITFSMRLNASSSTMRSWSFRSLR